MVKVSENRKKWIRIILVLLLMVLGSVVIKMFLQDKSINTKLDNVEYLQDKPLTTEQKLEDFEYLYNVLIEHHPHLEEYRDIIGFDFEGNREYYEELIRNTKDDYEFYVMMLMIMEDLPSLHTKLYVESFDGIKESGHNYSKEVRSAFLGSDRSEVWQEHNRKYILEETGETRFLYYDGKYISSLGAIAEQQEQTLILLAIDDEPIDKYIQRKEVSGKLGYDKRNDKVYRHSIGLNLVYGELVKATFQNGNGTVFEREVYIRNKECAFEEGNIVPISIPEVDKLVISGVEEQDIQNIAVDGPFQVVLDKKRNLSYISIASFTDENIEKEQFYNAMQMACENDDVILDLRINIGGYREYFLEYVYPWLYKEDISVPLEYYMDRTIIDDKFDDWVIRNYHDLNSAEEYMGSVVKLVDEYQGKGNGVKDKNVYVLISDTTYSAADWVAAILKEYTNAVLIGTDTGGEGLGGTAFFDIMPNSGLTFLVQDCQCFNTDGTDNSIFGTSPDFYISHTFESIAMRNQLINEDVSFVEYENRLRWDNILLETINMIESKKNNGHR